MNNKALYWIALGAFALALSSEYHNGNLPLAHQVADRAGSVLCQIATRAEQSLTLARVLTVRPSTEVSIDDQFIARQQAEVERVMAEHQADLDRAMALRQVDLDRVQQRLDRMHMVLDRVQIEKLHKLDRVRFRMSDAANRRMIVVCPETGARISVQPSADLLDMDEVSADVEVGESQ
jgi:hypothetical protein